MRFFGLFYLVLGGIEPLTSVLADIDATATFEDGTAVPAGTSLIVLCAIIALILWGGIHGAFVKPYLLVSVMRRYIEAGRASHAADRCLREAHRHVQGLPEGARPRSRRGGSGDVTTCPLLFARIVQ